MMSDLKRVLRLMPSAYYFRNNLLLSAFFIIMILLYGAKATDPSDLALVFFYCLFPCVMICTQLQRIEIPFIARTSPHRKRMVTVVPALCYIIMMMLCWCIMLVIMTILGPRCGLTPGYAFFYTVWFSPAGLLFNLSTAISHKINGVVSWIFMFLLIGGGVFAILLLPQVLVERVLAGLLTSSLSWVNSVSLTTIVLCGTLLTAPLYYAVLRALSGRMVSNRTMDYIK